VSAVKRQVPGSRGYAVQYPADATSQSAPTGREDVVKRLEAQSSTCPQQKFALVGYSQGAMVMRLAAPKIPAVLHSKILALVMFGDPGLRGGKSAFPGKLDSKLYENCAQGDPVCWKRVISHHE
jgi:Cutinase